MFWRLVSVSASGSNAITAETPWTIVRVGMTITFLSLISAACCAARRIFGLFGKTKTLRALTFLIACAIVSMLGFIVCPPEIRLSVPRLLKTSSMPSPTLTATMPSSFSLALSFAVSSRFCSRMFSIFTRSISPKSSASWRTFPGALEWTWTLMMSSSFTTTTESPIFISFSRKSSICFAFAPDSMCIIKNSVQ